ncbi:MAG: hypothetical protein JW720_13010 [Sedimentisphaerales bacterium]|nr:hypothetical protein [Sedimentisphaerales bacterium]
MQPVICRASVVALDKNAGRAVWSYGEPTKASAHGNPIAAEYKDDRLISQILRDCAAAIDAKTGKLLWRDLFDEYCKDRKRLVNANVQLYFNGVIHTAGGLLS